jgi:hypothetical protein
MLRVGNPARGSPYVCVRIIFRVRATVRTFACARQLWRHLAEPRLDDDGCDLYLADAASHLCDAFARAGASRQGASSDPNAC